MKIHKQKGLSLIGFILVLSLALFVSFLGMKIGPIYMEYFAVVSAMDDMASERGNAKRSPDQLRRRLKARLYVSYSNNIEDRHIKFSRSNVVRMRVAYEVRKPIIGNLDIVAKFDRSVRLVD